MDAQTEITLIAQVLKGQRECFRPLVEAYQRKVFHLACSLVGNPTEAQDIAQETFLTAFQNLGRLKQHARFSSWLFGITRNLCYEALRQRKLDPQPFEETQDYAAPQVISLNKETDPNQDLVRQMMARLERLPEKYRVLLRLKYLENYRYAEIAELLDLPVDLVRSRLFEGRRILREGLERAKGHESYGG